VRGMRVAMLVTALVMLFAACSGDDDASDASNTTQREPAETNATTTDTESVDVATFNVLHGLFCPAETDWCHAPDRAALLASTLEDAGCPELVGLQEISERQEEVLPASLEAVCDGRYEMKWNDINSPDQQVVLTTLPVVDEAYVDIANAPWEAYWVRVDTEQGPVDFITAHFASSSNNPPCDASLCPPVCDAGIETNQCHAHEVVDFFEQRGGPAAITVVAGDLNATPDTPTIAVLTDAGFTDAWLAAGNDECDADTGVGCTGGRPRPENALDGLDVPDGRYSERIDFVLTRGDGECEPDVVKAENLAGEPLAEPFNGLYWPSDHAGVVAELRCG
jgi:endonuclease/exonuclease/phosphatase family metal-dependent hydrolase